MPLDHVSALLDAEAPALLERWRVPGVAVAVVSGGESRSFGFGVTNVDHPLAVDGRTLFQIGSVTKTFQTALTLQEIESGRLALDTRVASLLPELSDAELTVEHLLTHRSGLFGDELLIHGSQQPGGHRLLDGVAALAGARQVLPAGSATSYNNAAYTILGALSCRLAGVDDWAALVRDRVLGPAGLTHSFTTADEVITHRVAAPHLGGVVARNFGWQRGWQLSGWDVPVGGLISSADDLAAWLSVQLNDGQGADGRVVTAESARLARVPRVPWGAMADHVGLTWWLREVGGATLVGHGGQTMGYETNFWFLPDHGLGWATLTNAVGGGGALNRELRLLLLEALTGIVEPEPVFDPSVDVTPHLGRYDLPFGDTVVEAGSDLGTIRLRAESKRATRPGWFPPPGEDQIASFVDTQTAIVTGPPRFVGSRLVFGRTGPTDWLMSGGRIGPRISR